MTDKQCDNLVYFFSVAAMLFLETIYAIGYIMGLWVSGCFHSVSSAEEAAGKVIKGFSLVGKQVTRGHNIVADGWAGAWNPYPYPPPPYADSHTQTIITDGWTDGLTDGHMDRRMDGQSLLCRVASPQLKMDCCYKINQEVMWVGRGSDACGQGQYGSGQGL